METTNIYLTQLTTEPDFTPQTSTNSDNNEPLQESYYELLQGAPDKYFSDDTQFNSSYTHKTPEIHHTKRFFGNEQKQPLEGEDIAYHNQFDQERNMS